jgi:hypothetical protein
MNLNTNPYIFEKQLRKRHFPKSFYPQSPHFGAFFSFQKTLGWVYLGTMAAFNRIK